MIDFTFDPVPQTNGISQPKSPGNGTCGSKANADRVTSTQQTVSTEGRELEALPTDHTNDPWPLDVTVYDCGYPVPTDGIIDGFAKVDNSTCNYC